MKVREASGWIALFGGAGTVIIFIALNSMSPFESGNFAQSLVYAELVLTVSAYLFGPLALPKWQGYLALTIAIVMTLLILFTPPYTIH